VLLVDEQPAPATVSAMAAATQARRTYRICRSFHHIQAKPATPSAPDCQTKSIFTIFFIG
jgi:hypothetical protein